MGNHRDQGTLKNPEFIAIGEILTAHGIAGEVRVRVLTDFPERFHERSSFFFHHPTRMPLRRMIRILEARPHKKNLILRLEGVCDRTTALTLIGVLIQIRMEDRRPLPEGSYYLFQIEGLEVFDEEGRRLGVIEEIIHTPAHDIYQTRGEATYLIPALNKVIRKIDLAENRMIVDMTAIEGEKDAV
ncbi:MAG: ribosome maturation factor RimM [bacterium]